MPAALRLLFAVFTVAITSDVATRAESTPPRYAFKVGQELSYRMDWTNTTKTKSGTHTDLDRHEIKVWVERQNPDESFHLIFCDDVADTQTRGQKTTELPHERNLMRADVFDDGRQLPCYPTNFGAMSAYIFPPLPKNIRELKAGWTETAQDFRFESKVSNNPAGFAFDAKVFSPFYGVLADNHASHYMFDTATSFTASSDETITVRGKYSMDGFGGLKFLQSQMLTDAAMKQLTNNADAYFSAMLAYDQQIEAAIKAGQPTAEKLLVAAGTNLKSAIGQLTDPIFRSSAQELLDHHGETTQDAMKRIKLLDDHIGKPAFAFTTTDLDGNVVRLADQQGKVVVLDFWYRGCGWCVRTMPLVNGLVTDFADKPVKFYAMSIDADPADARFVVKQLEVKSTTLRAEKLAAPFGVTGYPTLIVIDKHGKVRHFEDGYRADLRQELGKLIDDLLRES